MKGSETEQSTVLYTATTDRQIDQMAVQMDLIEKELHGVIAFINVFCPEQATEDDWAKSTERTKKRLIGLRDKAERLALLFKNLVKG